MPLQASDTTASVQLQRLSQLAPAYLCSGPCSLRIHKATITPTTVRTYRDMLYGQGKVLKQPWIRLDSSRMLQGVRLIYYKHYVVISAPDTACQKLLEAWKPKRTKQKTFRSDEGSSHRAYGLCRMLELQAKGALQLRMRFSMMAGYHSGK